MLLSTSKTFSNALFKLSAILVLNLGLFRPALAVEPPKININGGILPDGVSPTRGDVGTTVTIRGTNFAEVLAVKLGNLNCAYTVNSNSNISATVPVGALSGRFSVQNTAGTATSSAVFSVAMRIDSFSPANGAANTEVTILGANFNDVTAVYFGDIRAAQFTRVSSTEVRATAPQGGTTGVITLRNFIGRVSTASPFAYGLPTLVPLSAIISSNTPLVATKTDTTPVTQNQSGGPDVSGSAPTPTAAFISEISDANSTVDTSALPETVITPVLSGNVLGSTTPPVDIASAFTAQINLNLQFPSGAAPACSVQAPYQNLTCNPSSPISLSSNNIENGNFIVRAISSNGDANSFLDSNALPTSTIQLEEIAVAFPTTSESLTSTVAFDSNKLFFLGSPPDASQYLAIPFLYNSTNSQQVRLSRTLAANGVGNNSVPTDWATVVGDEVCFNGGNYPATYLYCSKLDGSSLKQIAANYNNSKLALGGKLYFVGIRPNSYNPSQMIEDLFVYDPSNDGSVSRVIENQSLESELGGFQQSFAKILRVSDSKLLFTPGLTPYLYDISANSFTKLGGPSSAYAQYFTSGGLIFRNQSGLSYFDDSVSPPKWKTIANSGVYIPNSSKSPTHQVGSNYCWQYFDLTDPNVKCWNRVSNTLYKINLKLIGTMKAEDGMLYGAGYDNNQVLNRMIQLDVNNLPSVTYKVFNVGVNPGYYSGNTNIVHYQPFRVYGGKLWFFINKAAGAFGNLASIDLSSGTTVLAAPSVGFPLFHDVTKKVLYFVSYDPAGTWPNAKITRLCDSSAGCTP